MTERKTRSACRLMFKVSSCFGIAITLLVFQLNFPFFFERSTTAIAAQWEVPTLEERLAWSDKVRHKFMSLVKMPSADEKTIKWTRLDALFWYDQKGIVHDIHFRAFPQGTKLTNCKAFTTEFTRAIVASQPIPQMCTNRRTKTCCCYNYRPFPSKKGAVQPVWDFTRIFCTVDDI